MSVEVLTEADLRQLPEQLTILQAFTKDAIEAGDSEKMAEAVSYLIENYGLISEIEPLPHIPGREKAIINDEPSSPHDEEAMRGPRELSNGYY